MDAAAPSVTLQIPHGTAVARPDAIVGRSSVAAVRIDDQRISTVHAELSWRAEGFVLLARGGRLVVDGRALREVILAEGLVVTLAPGVAIRVVAIDGGDACVIPPTVGRDRLRYVVGTEELAIHLGASAEPTLRLTGVAARIVEQLLARGGAGVSWQEIAEGVWPEDGAIRRSSGWTEPDERRFRNRWDQQMIHLRRSLSALRGGTLLRGQQGVIAIGLEPSDVVERS